MRIPPNLRYVILFLLLIALVVAGTIYLPELIPGIGRYLTWLIIAVMSVLMVFVFIKPGIGFLYARADGIFKVYLDTSEEGFHVFAYHIHSGGDGDSLRDILHYFIRKDTGKLYYSKLFSHFMTPADGRSGWDGFYSFEESVLGSPKLGPSLAKLSARAGLQLSLGDAVKENGEAWDVYLPGVSISIRKFDGLADKGFVIEHRDPRSGLVQWKRKI